MKKLNEITSVENKANIVSSFWPKYRTLEWFAGLSIARMLLLAWMLKQRKKPK